MVLSKAMRFAFRYFFPAACAVLTVYLCTFAVGNTDFWWHIKAGQLFRTTGWITLDPFAYTREGQAYLANHEWLAQVILSFIYDAFGPTGIVILRMVIVLLTFGVVTLLDRSHIWRNSALALLAAILARPALTDRPQLFTFLLFSIVVCLCLTYFDAKKSDRNRILFFLPILFVLWSNLHGAAGIVGIAVFGALGLQRIVDGAEKKEILLLLLSGALCTLALIITPSGIGNVLYTVQLMGDKTTDLIAEWQGAAWPAYIKHVGLFWILAIVSLWKGRRHVVFSMMVLLGIGYLSKSAQRHEVLFLIAALAISIVQLRSLSLEAFSRRSNMIISVVALLLLTFCTVVQSYRFTMQNHTFGFGEFTPLKNASAFITEEGITGNMFNNYNAGGELLFRGHKVFLDGRNLDYGYDYISRAVDAGIDQSVWSRMAQEYSFTHAVIYYALEARNNPIPYIDILQKDPNWGLVYLDDWTAVYAKGHSDTFTQITPKMLYTLRMPESISLGGLQELEQEVLHIMQNCPQCTKARMYHERMLQAFASKNQ